MANDQEASPKLRLRDVACATAVASVYLGAISAEMLTGDYVDWPSFFATAFFVIPASLGVMLASVFLVGRPRRALDCPAVWLAIQAIVWNPIAWGFIGAAVQHWVPPDQASLSSVMVIATVGLVCVALPTCLLGIASSPNRRWTIAYCVRLIQSLFAAWLVIFPILAFVPVLLVAAHSTRGRYDWVHRLSVGVVLMEQLGAIIWFFIIARDWA